MSETPMMFDLLTEPEPAPPKRRPRRPRKPKAKPLAIQGGILHGVPFANYLLLEGVNGSSLKRLSRSPLHYAHDAANPTKTKPMVLGTAAHTATLEMHRFLLEYALWDRRTDAGDIAPRRGKAWEDFVAANPNRRILTVDEYETALAIRDAVLRNPDARRYLSAGEAEPTLRWKDERTGLLCKGRLDWLTPDGTLVGLKTTTDCRPRVFGNQAARLGYHIAWAYYHDGFKALTGISAKSVEIVVESAAPHDVAVYRITEDILLAGRDEYMRLLDRYAECLRTNRWPGAVEGEDDLTLPSWVYGTPDTDLSDLGLE